MIKLYNFLFDELGATAVEYGMFVGGVSLTIAGAMSAFSDEFVAVTDQLTFALSVGGV